MDPHDYPSPHAAQMTPAELRTACPDSSPGHRVSQTQPSGLLVRNPPANAGDTGSIPGPGRSHMPQSNQTRALQLLKPECRELMEATAARSSEH
ncbi:hypothetical protein AB1E18_017602 [Capra hircus]